MATDINSFSIPDISLLPVASVTLLSLTYLKLDLQGGIHKGNRETVSACTQMFTGVAFSTLFSTYLYSVIPITSITLTDMNMLIIGKSDLYLRSLYSTTTGLLSPTIILKSASPKIKVTIYPVLLLQYFLP